jgi:hypothetical protein
VLCLIFVVFLSLLFLHSSLSSFSSPAFDNRYDGRFRQSRPPPHERVDPLFPRHMKEKPGDPKATKEVEGMQRTYPTVDPVECPSFPDPDYPRAYPVLDVLKNWPPDSPTARPDRIHQQLCTFDYGDVDQREAALRYQEAEVPFIVRGVPDLDEAVLRWGGDGYLEEMFGGQEFKVEYSENNHFMYWRSMSKRQMLDFKPPTSMVDMTYPAWLSKALTSPASPASPHWYFRASGCSSAPGQGCPPPNFERLFEELPIFQPLDSLFVVDPTQQRGIHCRFGMEGIIAENHFDGARNFVALIGGERR